MRKTYRIVWWAAALMVAACQQQTVYRAASGLQFMIEHGDTAAGAAAGSGATVKLAYTLRHGDSVVSTTVGRMPLYQPLIPGLIFPYSPMEALISGVHPGDSLVVWQRVDSLRRKGMLAQLPKGWRMSDRITATMKVLAVFPFDYTHGDSAVKADKLAEATALLEREQPRAAAHMAQWLKERSITATHTSGGVFVQVLQAGTGPVADSGSTVPVRYICSTLSGRVLDANIDTSFHHPPVLTLRVGAGMLPPAIDAAIRTLQVGSHVRIYVPRGVGVPPSALVQQGQVPGEDVKWELWL